MKVAAIGLAGVVMALSTSALLEWRSKTHVVSAGFWFEDVSYDSSEAQAARLAGEISGREIDLIQSLAWSELRAAYAGLRIVFSNRRDAMYAVRVVQTIRPHPLSPFRSRFEPAGESRFARPIGGSGSVSFRMLVNNAIAHAPADADRAKVIEGIGRGVGRAAAHEFAHLFLATAPIHESRDVRSYEYRSADRAEQYYGSMHWDIAGPLLRDRLGTVALPRASSSR